jgi:hypothetical protein
MEQKTVIGMGATRVGRTMEDLINISNTKFKVSMMNHFRFNKSLLMNDIKILYDMTYVFYINKSKLYIGSKDHLNKDDQVISYELIISYGEQLKKIIMVLLEYKNINMS